MEKRGIPALLIILVSWMASCAPARGSADIDENLAYLGQIPPGLSPQVFAPGMVSVESAVEFAASFSADGQELYFTRRIDGQENAIFETHLTNGGWTDPAPATFAAGYNGVIDYRCTQR